MKAIFIGTVQLSFVLLKILIQKDIEIIGAISSKNNNFNSDYADLSGVCKKNKIPTFYTKNINSDKAIKWIKNK